MNECLKRIRCYPSAQQSAPHSFVIQATSPARVKVGGICLLSLFFLFFWELSASSNIICALPARVNGLVTLDWFNYIIFLRGLAFYLIRSVFIFFLGVVDLQQQQQQQQQLSHLSQVFEVGYMKPKENYAGSGTWISFLHSFLSSCGSSLIKIFLVIFFNSFYGCCCSIVK